MCEPEDAEQYEREQIDYSDSKYFSRDIVFVRYVINHSKKVFYDRKWKTKSHEKRQEKLLKFARETWCAYNDYYVAGSPQEEISSDDDEE